MAIAGPVINAAEPGLVDFERGTLRQPAGLSLLQHCKIGQAEFQAFGRKHITKMAQPLCGVDVGIVSMTCSRSENAHIAPCPRYLSKWEKIVFAFNSLEFRQQSQVGPKSSESLKETGKTLAGGIEYAVVTSWVVESIAERAFIQAPARNARAAPRISGAIEARSPSRNRRNGTRSPSSGFTPVIQA